VVKENDVTREGNNETSSTTDSESTGSCTHEESNNDLDLELGIPALPETKDGKDNVDDAPEEDEAQDYLTLPCCRKVPNCCAVCLSSYSAGDRVDWSSNEACKHAFHEDCILDWLTKNQDGTPCPCCRQEFIALDLTLEGTGKSQEDP